MRYFNFIYMFFLTLFFACLNNKKEDPKIYPLHPCSAYVSGIYNGKTYIVGKDYFIITSAPNDTSNLKRLINSFNQNNPIKGLDTFTSYQRAFYKEASNFNKDFKETKYDRVDDHYEEMIAEFKWTEKGKFKDLIFYKDGELITNAKAVELKSIDD